MRFLALCGVLALTGCAGIPDSTLNALAQSGGGCAKSTGMWGSILVMSVGSDKGVIRNGELSVAGECGGIVFRDAAAVKAVPPVPGTITTITTPATSTTTVQPTK